MIDTIEKALNPLSLTLFFFGLGILRYPLDHPRLCLSIFYILIVWSVYICVFLYVVILFSPKHIFNGFLTCFITMMNLLVTTTSVIITIREHEKIHTCVRKLGLVDDTLKEFGTPKEYHKIRNSIKWMLIIWCLMISITSIVNSLWCIVIFKNAWVMIIPFVMNYTFYINTFMDITFMFLLRYIGTRLDKINGHLEQLSEIEECGLRCTWKKPLITSYFVRSADNRKCILWAAMHLHSELCRVAHKLNDLFGVQMTLQMTCYFVVLIGMFCFQYHTMLCLKHMYGNNIEKLITVLCSDIWCTICLIKVILLNYICENVGAKAQKTKSVIHKLTSLIYFAELREEICQFVLQISLRPLKFNGMGLFYFGHNFIRKKYLHLMLAFSSSSGFSLLLSSWYK